MDIELSDILVENMEALCDFIHNDYKKKINDSSFLVKNVLDKPFISTIDKEMITFDYKWEHKETGMVYKGSHCFVYPKKKTLHILNDGRTEESKEHQKYIKENIDKFETMLKRDKLINEVT